MWSLVGEERLGLGVVEGWIGCCGGRRVGVQSAGAVFRLAVRLWHRLGLGRRMCG